MVAIPIEKTISRLFTLSDEPCEDKDRNDFFNYAHFLFELKPLLT